MAMGNRDDDQHTFDRMADNSTELPPQCRRRGCREPVTEVSDPYCSRECEEVDTEGGEIELPGDWSAKHDPRCGVIIIRFKGEHINEIDTTNFRQMEAWKEFHALLTGASKP